MGRGRRVISWLKRLFLRRKRKSGRGKRRKSGKKSGNSGLGDRKEITPSSSFLVTTECSQNDIPGTNSEENNENSGPFATPDPAQIFLPSQSNNSSAVPTGTETTESQHKGSCTALPCTSESENSQPLDSAELESKNTSSSLLSLEQDDRNTVVKPLALSKIDIATNQSGGTAFEVNMTKKQQLPTPAVTSILAISFEKRDREVR